MADGKPGRPRILLRWKKGVWTEEALYQLMLDQLGAMMSRADLPYRERIACCRVIRDLAKGDEAKPEEVEKMFKGIVEAA